MGFDLWCGSFGKSPGVPFLSVISFFGAPSPLRDRPRTGLREGKEELPKRLLPLPSSRNPQSDTSSSPKPFFPGPDHDVQPILLRGIRTGIFFVELAERIDRPIEIDQHFPSGHGFDREIAPLWISLCV